ncbi:DinB family protein [Labilibacter sediminis]|nr:DinB family protein [Labilibacter sediminis]
MTNMDFSAITNGISQGLENWESKLMALPEDTMMNKRNSQDRTIKQIIGHMVDSVSNNTHRIIHLQYQESPFSFPNYATNGNNDRWIAIQDYQNENWENLIQHWKYSHIHLIHVIASVNRDKLDNEWISGSEDGNVKLKDMIIDFLRHFHLHLGEIQELIDK